MTTHPSSLSGDPGAAIEFSHYAARLVVAQPAMAAAVQATLDQPFVWSEAVLGDLQHAETPAGLNAALRQLRQRSLLHTLLRDLTARADLGEVCATMTRLAEESIRASVRAHHGWIAHAHGEPIGADSGEPQRMMVVAMGKLGGGELNVCSDVDLVFVYPEDGATAGPKPLANQEFFDRLGRRVIGTLADVTEDAFVFRVDMRLRPYGDSGPLSSSLAALEAYLVAQGRTWERYAWLKARALTGDRSAELERLVEPFVFRKYLDYDAYAGLRDVHRQIREQGRRRGYQRNIKLGPGGIREIEFIVQALQLVRGGREPALRERGTMPALATLGARGLLPRTAVEELSAAYVFLRRLEHRLQYRDDAQTHDVPSRGAERTTLARACGFADAKSFTSALEAHRAAVERHFSAVLGEEQRSDDDALAAVWVDPAPEQGQVRLLAEAGYREPAAVLESLTRLRRSSRYLQLPTLSRQRFDALVPQLLRTAMTAAQTATTSDPRHIFERLLALLETVSGRSVYLALLTEHPPVLPRIAQLMGASAWAADYLLRHPILLDELLDSRVLLAEPDWSAWRSDLDTVLAAHPHDAERQIDALRHFQHAQVFRLLAQDLTGMLTVERLADHLSALADIVLAGTLGQCWPLISPSAHAPPRFAIIGYGKLGGKELGYASDLDLVFLYDDPDPAAAERYARLAQRVNTWLTSLTAAGRLYDTDLRLRPDGVSGLLVSSLGTFRDYQREHAWTWEHQALTRARFVAGDPALGAAFEAEREAILRLARDLDRLKSDVTEMRRRMQAGHPNPGPGFDLKHDPGGMVDVEFAVQYLVLGYAHAHRDLTRNAGNIALLGLAAKLGLLPPDLAVKAADAYRDYRKLQHQIRLQGAPAARVDPVPQAERRAAVDRLWLRVFGAPRTAG
ncbi:MAG TPA: bifunctional [glutamate--ammonia ligase]-adenylyl-L-tyrosine phosphorylase/[glutamate--ammonia-ligase] adenylyltransferase [Casimicrobiaceae bacterium]|jgi:glutamate-ammonia-ligase adenylyltransferase|nr:bifunctional [glutamate--ammonia ligase]-adenylyl-L-tyrosine phosphorylase/[glutamate--ammonia-ligase] adenylyltransferase [Casimicrobiaceae bacterium]